MNLTWEVRDGIISHCGEDFTTCKLEPGSKDKILEKITCRKEADYPATLEGCIVRLIDKVAYCGKDIEDALAAEIIDEVQIPKFIREELGHTNGRIIGTCLESIIEESKDKDYIAISPKYGKLMHKLIQFNNKNIYHSEKSEGYSKQAEQTLKLLYKDILALIKKTNRLSSNFSDDKKTPGVYRFLKEYCDEYCSNGTRIYSDKDPDEIIALDFVAGMTDTFAVRSFEELFVPKATV